MQLTHPQKSHLLEMMSWFSCEQELTDWAGPNFRYPFDVLTFTEDLKLDMLSSFALISSTEELLGFGQYYLRLNRCHLGRIVINPKMRGKGIASELMSKLNDKGMQDLKVAESSLFVLAHNVNAIKAYEKFGFVFANYPEEIPMDNCLYMVRPSNSEK